MEESDRKLRKSANIQGEPVRFLSKILNVGINYYIDPTGDCVFVAEAGGNVSALRLSTNEISISPRGPQAPVTSLAFFSTRDSTDSSVTNQVFAGCWDQSIWKYTIPQPAEAAAGQPILPSSYKAHTDFVKCLLIATTPDKQNIILSGGADGDIRFWTLDGQSLGGLKPQCRGIECLVIDPLSTPDAPVITFSTSQREIFRFVLPVSTSLREVKLSTPFTPHETSVYKLYFDNDGDLWTASADKTAKHLVRENGWSVDTTLTHPDFVRDIVIHDKYGLVITACRDEEVRVWNGATGQLHHIFTGHFEEVTGLALTGDLLISVSIDATLRRWSLAPADLTKAIEEAKNPKLEDQIPEPTTDLGMLTAEEEAELRALMENEETEALEKMAMDEQ